MKDTISFILILALALIIFVIGLALFPLIAVILFLLATMGLFIFVVGHKEDDY